MSQRKLYPSNLNPSNLTPQQWAALEPILHKALYGRKRKPLGAPRQYSLYDIVCTILYVLVIDCAWRQLLHDLPPWKMVYYPSRCWQQLDVLVERAFAW